MQLKTGILLTPSPKIMDVFDRFFGRKNVRLGVNGNAAHRLIGCPPAADYVPYWCHGLEVYPGSCSGLPPRSLLSNPGHQRSQFTPLIRTGDYSLFLLLVPPQPRPVHSRWLAPLCMEWASPVAKIAPQDSF